MALHTEMRQFMAFMRARMYLDGVPVSPAVESAGLGACRKILDALVLETRDKDGRLTQTISEWELHMTMYNLCVSFLRSPAEKHKILRHRVAPDLSERYVRAEDMRAASEHIPMPAGDNAENDRVRRTLTDQNCSVGEMFWYKPDPVAMGGTIVLMCYLGAPRGGWHYVQATFPTPRRRMRDACARLVWEHVGLRHLNPNVVNLVAAFLPKLEETKWY